MLSLEPELGRLRDDGVLDDTSAARLIAIERREVVSIYPELRVLTWAGVMLISWGVGLFVSKHLDDIGPLAISAGIGIASLACYAWSFWKRGREASLADDYVLLLAALLASAEVGYVEYHYHLLGDHWSRHFLFLALLHGATAYVFQSRLVLSLSVTSLAAWLGIEKRGFEAIFDAPVTTAWRSFDCAAIVLVWRAVDRAVHRTTTFSSLFDNTMANLAFWGALTLAVHGPTRPIGCAIAVVLAMVSMVYGWRAREVIFIIYAWVYGMIAVDIAICVALKDEVLIMLYLLVSTIAAIAGLFISTMRMRRTA